MKRAIFGLCAAAGPVSIIGPTQAATKSQWLGGILAVRAQASVTPGNIRYAVQIPWGNCAYGAPADDTLGKIWYETALAGGQLWIEGNGDCTDPYGGEGVSFIQAGFKPIPPLE
jgi:hypothetical protein